MSSRNSPTSKWLPWHTNPCPETFGYDRRAELRCPVAPSRQPPSAAAQCKSSDPVASACAQARDCISEDTPGVTPAVVWDAMMFGPRDHSNTHANTAVVACVPRQHDSANSLCLRWAAQVLCEQDEVRLRLVNTQHRVQHHPRLNLTGSDCPCTISTPGCLWRTLPVACGERCRSQAQCTRRTHNCNH